MQDVNGKELEAIYTIMNREASIMPCSAVVLGF